MKTGHYLTIIFLTIICLIFYVGCDEDIRGSLQNTNSFASYIPWWKDTNMSSTNLIYPETNNLIDIGNSNMHVYVTGTPIYVESDPIWTHYYKYPTNK